MSPLTTIPGSGVLSQTNDAPLCYPQKMFKNGTASMNKFWEYPNIIDGVVGNEIMNNLRSWRAAPCVKACLDDLVMYGNHISISGIGNGQWPCCCHYSIKLSIAEQLSNDATKLTFDYHFCKTKEENRTENSSVL